MANNGIDYETYVPYSEQGGLDLSPEKLFSDALLLVESSSIRAWAQSTTNRPLNRR